WLPYYMLPKSIQVVSKFPVTANGKLDKKALLALSVSSLEESIEATTKVQLLVSKVTGELLNLDKVDLARNFFELGGTSIQAAQLRNSIMSELEVNLPLATVFNAVSLQSLTQEIEQQMKSQSLMEHLLSSEEDEADEEFII
ncbi:MAG: phosphopantetheine-binding protein, partial [Marinomonas sp.]